MTRVNLGRYADPEYLDAALYDLENPWGPDDDFFLALARREGGPVLDLGCGTGRLARAIARAGLDVTGIEPVPAMLARARALSGDHAIDYVPGDARRFRLDRRFRLVTMTAHAFQHLLGAADQAAALGRIAEHLVPGGLFAFDLRNIAVQNFDAPGLFRGLRNFYDEEGRRIDFEHMPRWDATNGRATYLLRRRRQATGETWRSRVVLQYTEPDALDMQLRGAGLELVDRYGDWPGLPFVSDSPEIISVCRKA
ncbi:MAG TPA: class I SAM-dependent methyltransferase [Aliidongia sp.]|nr:class I SAM-dependent methyltransferase [Aliidongia sp.]